MADVKVVKEHNMSVEEARTKVGDFESMLKKYGVKVKWSGNRGEIKGAGVSGTVEVSSVNIAIHLKLGLLAKAAGIKADRLTSSIEKRLSTAIDGPA